VAVQRYKGEDVEASRVLLLLLRAGERCRRRQTRRRGELESNQGAHSQFSHCTQEFALSSRFDGYIAFGYLLLTELRAG